MELMRVRVEYMIEIDLEDFKKILDYDSHIDSEDLDTNDLFSRLEDMKLMDYIEYNGHFGPGVFYRVEEEDDNADLHVQVMEVVKEYIEEAKAALEVV